MMLTEVNALQMAQSDGKKAFRMASKGAVPQDLSKHVLVTVIRRIKEFEVNRGKESAFEIAKRAARQQKNAPTFSEQLAARILTIYEATIPMLVPEDARALSLYLCGVPEQISGYLKAIMECIGETSGEEALKLCIGRIQARVDRMHQMDRNLFENEVKILTGPKQRIIAGQLMDAQWTFSEGDGINSRNHLVKAREMSLRWIRESKAPETR